MWFLCCMYEVTEICFSLCWAFVLWFLKIYFQLDLLFILKSGAQGEVSVSCPFTRWCRNPSGFVAQLQKLTAAAVASTSTEVDTQWRRGKAPPLEGKWWGSATVLSKKSKREHPFVCYYWKTVCCIRHLFWRLINKPFRLEINYFPVIVYSRPCTATMIGKQEAVKSITTWHME